MMKRIFLLAGVIGWGISLLGVLLPWSVMDIVLQNMGAKAPVSDLQIQYWFRMATGAWSIIGFFYLSCFTRAGFPEVSVWISTLILLLFTFNTVMPVALLYISKRLIFNACKSFIALAFFCTSVSFMVFFFC